jgi:hypothetical protein
MGLKKIITRIIRENINICNILNVNTSEELLDLLNSIDIHKDDVEKVDKIVEKMKKDMKNLSSKYDILDTYLHDIQDIICKRKYPDF